MVGIVQHGRAFIIQVIAVLRQGDKRMGQKFTVRRQGNTIEVMQHVLDSRTGEWAEGAEFVFAEVVLDESVLELFSNGSNPTVREQK